MMLRLRYGRTMRAVMVVCAAMQLMALLPHHHHEGEQGACVNIFHCQSGCFSHYVCCSGDALPADVSDVSDVSDLASCGNDALPTHNHDAGNSDCSLKSQDAIRPERGDSAGANAITASCILEEVFTAGTASGLCANEYHGLLSVIGDRVHAGAEPPHTSYIAAALPPRAPSFSA